MTGAQYFTATGDTAPIPRVSGTGPTRVAGSARNRARARLLKGGGLVVVAVLAGLVWWLFRHDGVPAVEAHAVPSQGPLSAGAFEYTVATQPVTGTDCAAHSYGRIQQWFAAYPCERLSRGLYITEVRGARALVSVSVVTMPSAEQAGVLHEMAYTSGTGNVNDLVREGVADIANAPNVARGEYRSKLVGSRVTIVEANFFGDYSDEELLGRIAADSRRLAQLLR